ncbi:MAG: hypothetical protein OXT68_08785 [Chloroflexota bacterium]|nr:hypothetical protein [Chloroflexota bacterium]
MKDYEKEIAQKYLLPERPFLHGIASAFDLFGVLSQGKNEQLLANLQEEFERRDRDALRSAWRKVGETLYWAVIQYEKAGGERSNQ